MTKRFENSCAEIEFRIKTSCRPMTWPANWMKVAILFWPQYVKIIILNEWQRYALLKIKVVTPQIFHMSFYKMHAVTGYWGYYFHTFPDNLWLSVLLVWLDLWWNNIKIIKRAVTIVVQMRRSVIILILKVISEILPSKWQQFISQNIHVQYSIHMCI